MLADYFIRKLNAYAEKELSKIPKNDIHWDVVEKIREALPKNIFKRTESCIVVLCYEFYMMGLNNRTNPIKEKAK
ncbi:unnamed protein product [marine sediment metagenome]|uniref:Uncharacterized protein n=1 Tax=marine sediment metagenome TaxID=412755 RepID=X0ZMD3_9ZZZZ